MHAKHPKYTRLHLNLWNDWNSDKGVPQKSACQKVGRAGFWNTTSAPYQFLGLEKGRQSLLHLSCLVCMLETIVSASQSCTWKYMCGKAGTGQALIIIDTIIKTLEPYHLGSKPSIFTFTCQAVWCSTSHYTSLCIGFFLTELVAKMKWGSTCKELRTASGTKDML